MRFQINLARREIGLFYLFVESQYQMRNNQSQFNLLKAYCAAEFMALQPIRINRVRLTARARKATQISIKSQQVLERKKQLKARKITELKRQMSEIKLWSKVRQMSAVVCKTESSVRSKPKVQTTTKANSPMNSRAAKTAQKRHTAQSEKTEIKESTPVKTQKLQYLLRQKRIINSRMKKRTRAAQLAVEEDGIRLAQMKKSAENRVFWERRIEDDRNELVQLNQQFKSIQQLLTNL